MMRRLARILFIVPMLPAAAGAADLSLSLMSDAMYDSNVFRRESNIDDDVLFRLRPGIELHEDRGQDVNYSLGYELPVQFAVDNSNQLNDIDQVANGDIRYHVNDRFDLFASDNFRYLRSTVQLADLDPDSAAAGQGIPILSTERDRVTLNAARLGGSYRFAPRLSGNLIAQHQYFNTTLENRQENWSTLGSADLQYTLNSRHIVGAGVRYIHAKFEPAETLAGSTSDTYNLFASWRYQVTETTAFSAAAGPSYIETESDPQTGFVVPAVPTLAGSANTYAYALGSCPTVGAFFYIPSGGCGTLLQLTPAEVATIGGLPPTTVVNLNPASERNSDLTVFAEVALSQRWTPNLASAVRYERSQGNASGLGGTVTRDAVSFATTWDFAERWQLALRGDWTHRKSVADVAQVFSLAQPYAVGTGTAAAFSGQAITLTQPNARIETDRWGVAGRVTHRLWRNTSVFAEVAYNEQDSKKSTLGGFSDFEDFMATLAIRHVFEPIKVW